MNNTKAHYDLLTFRLQVVIRWAVQDWRSRLLSW